jgi:hypothetical protein
MLSEVMTMTKHEENARLIAAAPKMLMTLESALTDLERLFDGRLDKPDTAQAAMAQRIRAAIAEATGKDNL